MYLDHGLDSKWRLSAPLGSTCAMIVQCWTRAHRPVPRWYPLRACPVEAGSPTWRRLLYGSDKDTRWLTRRADRAIMFAAMRPTPPDHTTPSPTGTEAEVPAPTVETAPSRPPSNAPPLIRRRLWACAKRYLGLSPPQARGREMSQPVDEPQAVASDDPIQEAADDAEHELESRSDQQGAAVPVPRVIRAVQRLFSSAPSRKSSPLADEAMESGAFLDVEVPADEYQGRTTAELSLEEREEIVERAKAQVKGLVDKGFVSYDDRSPLNVYTVIEKMGMFVGEGPLHASGIMMNGRKLAGAILKDVGADYPRIYLEKSGSSQHKLFTASHELGHYLFWCKDTTPAYRKSVRWGDIRTEHAASGHSGDRWPSEYAANTFAQFLLMPDELLAIELQSGKGTDQIARRFGVTRGAAIRRLSYFNINFQSYE